jgi:hypothetical protein
VPVPALAPPEGVVPVFPAAAGVVPVAALVVAPLLLGVLALAAEEVVVDVVEEVLLDAAAGTTRAADGTVNAGAPDVSPVLEPPPPQAATPRARSNETAIAVRDLGRRVQGLLMPTRRTSGAERLHTPAAVRAVVEILLSQLVAPIAEAEVVDHPRQLGGGGGEREQFGDDLELLAGLPV